VKKTIARKFPAKKAAKKSPAKKAAKKATARITATKKAQHAEVYVHPSSSFPCYRLIGSG
jgi:hypothetical protein